MECSNSALVASRRLLLEHRKYFIAEGVGLVMLGIAAMVLPTLATLALEMLIGWIVLVGGIMGLAMSFRLRNAPGFSWGLASAVLGIVAGLILLRWPFSGVVSLTVVLILFFVLDGSTSILFALEHRRQQSRNWAWMLASGALDIGLAAMILAGLPGTSTWAIGLLVGINMVFGGMALLAMAYPPLDSNTTGGLMAPERALTQGQS